jgi:hypothetical protein
MYPVSGKGLNGELCSFNQSGCELCNVPHGKIFFQVSVLFHCTDHKEVYSGYDWLSDQTP